jgi:hypothetical protein
VLLAAGLAAGEVGAEAGEVGVGVGAGPRTRAEFLALATTVRG